MVVRVKVEVRFIFKSIGWWLESRLDWIIFKSMGGVGGG